MSKDTKIAWCDSTFNPFIGCTKIGPGCDHCYAEVQDSRKRWGGTTHWGAGVARYRTSASNWAHPLRWNKRQGQLLAGWDAGCKTLGGEAALLKAGFSKPRPYRVFCASLADVFDNEVPNEWRADLWKLIEATPHLSWLIVTKRIGNVVRMVPSLDWLRFHDNVRILITVCNQEEADRDIPKLLALPCKNGISYEPALELVDWTKWLGGEYNKDSPRRTMGKISWLIIGGESGTKARSFGLGWARSAVEQCKTAGVPVFVKQLGARPFYEFSPGCDAFPEYADRAGADPAEWPEDLRVREFPE